MKKLASFIIFLVLFVGCTKTLPIGPIVSGVIIWMEGEANKYYSHDSGTLYRTTKKACKELKYPILQDEPDEESGYYYIVAGEKNRFKIKVEQVKPNISVVKCRIDFWGDKPYVELFYQKIDDQLDVIEFDQYGNPMSVKNKKGAFA